MHCMRAGGCALILLAISSLNVDGLPKSTSEPLISILPDGRQVRLSAEPDAETLGSIKAISSRDAERWGEFVAFMNEATGFLDAAYRTPMPRLPHVSFSEGMPLAQIGAEAAPPGLAQHVQVIRALPMSALELTEEWFESRRRARGGRRGGRARRDDRADVGRLGLHADAQLAEPRRTGPCARRGRNRAHRRPRWSRL